MSRMSINAPSLTRWLKSRSKHARKCHPLKPGLWSCGHREQTLNCRCHCCAAYDHWYAEYLNKMKGAYAPNLRS